MEADWEIELGGGAAVIDANWPGFVNLRRHPKKASELSEVLLLPALAPALVRLNSSGSALYTVKSDVWPVTEIDPLEFDAPLEMAMHGLAAYVDCLHRDPQLWFDPSSTIAWCKKFCAVLRAVPLRCCRADLVMRHAITAPDIDSIGITAYFAACGSTDHAARMQLGAVLALFADSVASAVAWSSADSKLQ
jgi:hypothetical protein